MPDILDDSDIAVDIKVKIDKPKMWKVILHNDNYTPMDFVVAILMEIFGKGHEEANKIMLLIHKTGRGVAGIYNHEIATQKSIETVTLAKSYGHPLQASVEEE